MFRILLFTQLLFISILFGLEAQTNADSLREIGQLNQALVEYRSLWELNPGDPALSYRLAATHALLHKRDSAFHYLKFALETDSTVRALNDPDFYFLLDDPRWHEVEEEQIEKVEAKYGAYEQPELARQLWQMKIKDQAFYYHIQLTERSSPNYYALWELKSRLNEANIQRLEELIAEYGWPKESKVKGSAAQAAFLIVQHSDLEIQKKYLPLMQEAADEGEARWSALALLIDRVRLREGKPQIYGSQIYRREDESFYVKDLEDPEYVNERREEVGLGPIEDYVKRWGIDWDIEQKSRGDSKPE